MTVRRVVVTGLGLVSPLGREVEGAWSRLVGGGHGIVRLVGQDYDKLPCKVAARVQGTWEGATKRDEKNMGQATLFALEAGKQALDNANWTPQVRSFYYSFIKNS
jgi:3-oxoacyl-[acyl-carrier-protein] synthase II